MTDNIPPVPTSTANETAPSNRYPWVKIVVISFIVSALTGYTFGLLAFRTSKNFSASNASQTAGGSGEQSVQFITNEDKAITEAVEKNSPAVVSIIISKDVSVAPRSPFFDFFSDPFFNPFGSGGETQRQEIGGGTGFIIGPEGFIVTNKHVVEDTAAQYKVLLNDGTEYEAQVLARDPVRDLAIIKIDARDLPAVELSDSTNLKIGQTVIAIGNSLGELRNTVSKGIISGLKRNVIAGDRFGRSETLGDVIQTDAAINPGNSGGPLIDTGGKVIAVNVAMAQGAENIGFALPINQVKRIYQQVREGGEITVPFLGIRYLPITKTIQQENSLPYDYGLLVIRGERVTDLAVIPGSPADKAGIVENDIVLEIDGEKITSERDFASVIADHEVGDEITLNIWHRGEQKELKATLEKRK